MSFHARKVNGSSGLLFSHIEPSDVHEHEKLIVEKPTHCWTFLLIFCDIFLMVLLPHYQVQNSPTENSQKVKYPLLPHSNVCVRKRLHTG